jgi:hypothetical protein
VLIRQRLWAKEDCYAVLLDFLKIQAVALFSSIELLDRSLFCTAKNCKNAVFVKTIYVPEPAFG